MNEEQVAKGLGWFSMGLGMLEAGAAKEVAAFLGIDTHKNLIRMFGYREMLTGLGILSRQRPTGWMWGRVAGDAIDLAVLASALDDDNPNRENEMGALVAVAGVTAVDIWCAWRLSSRTYLSAHAHEGNEAARRAPAIQTSPVQNAHGA